MKTHIMKITDGESLKSALQIAGKLIREGRLVAFPTETVYGLGANALDPDAVSRIFIAKGRPQDNPLIVHIDDYAKLSDLCSDIPESAKQLAKAFWPGPLTMVLKKKGIVPDITTAGLDTVAVRCPSNQIARALISAAGVPIAAPSANTSGKPSTTDAQHVITDMYGRIDAIIDGGASDIGLESTVVDLTVSPPRLLRPGGVTLEQLKSVLGSVEVDKAVVGQLEPNAKVRSPGMKYRHYAPEAQVIIVRGDRKRAAEYILSKSRLPGVRTAALCFDEEKELYKEIECFSYGPEKDYSKLARNLFSALRLLDSGGFDVIYARCPEGGGMSLAVENRLKKAAGFHIVDV